MEERISVIIGAKNECPQIVWTIYSIIADLESFTKNWEIILVDNISDDQTSDYLQTRGLVSTGKLKILFQPVAGNVLSRNKGVEVAEGEYVFFCDAHIAIKPGSFQRMVEALRQNPTAIVHPAVDWLGSYPEKPCYQYTLCLGEKFWGRWNRIKISDDPFAIPLCGHCCLGMRKDLFQKWGGYNPYFRVYGGGENYLNLKWWLFGGISLSVPQAVVWHSRFKRGYAFHSDDLIHNMMVAAYAIGGEKWSERILITYLNKEGTRPEMVFKLYNEALEEGRADREFILANQKMTFQELLDNPPWDTWNDKVHGWHKSYILTFQDWVQNLKRPEAIQFYNNSQFQKEDMISVNTK